MTAGVFHPRWGFWLVISGLALLINGSCASRTAENNEVSPKGSGTSAITKRLSSIRGLEFKREVPVLYESKAALTARLNTELANSFGDRDRLRYISLAYEKLGLFPRGFKLKESLVAFLGDEVAGFYSLKAKKVVLVDTPGILYSSSLHGGPGGMAEGTLAHEFTHALQDQHFAISDRLLHPTSGDKAMAYRSITEGDAILAELAYGWGGANGESLARIRRRIEKTPLPLEPLSPAVPAVLIDRFRFPYEAGATFVLRPLLRQGWTGVNLLHRFPPLSTEQVLHPEKYFDFPDPPTKVIPGKTLDLFPANWRLVDDNTLGELLVRCLLKNYMPPDLAIAAAAGWDGDRFLAFANGEEVGFVWLTVWDSEKDAQKFILAYEEVRSRKYSQSERRDLENYIERRANVVVVAEGLPNPPNPSSIEKIWRELRLEEEHFQSLASIPHDRQPNPSGR